MDADYLAPRRSRANLHPDVFLPPHTPALSRTLRHDHGSGTNLIASSKNQNGKRMRPTSGGKQSSQETPSQTAGNDWSASSSMVRSDIASPLNLVNTSYTLKGGLDTPSQEIEAAYDRMAQCAEINFRRRWSNPVKDTGSAARKNMETMRHNRNGSGLISSTAHLDSATPGWGASMFNFVGGVAGKMWDFCNTAVFGGFHAGGGQQYTWEGYSHGTSTSMQASSAWEDMSRSELRPVRSFDITFRSPSPMPGMWPEQASPDFKTRCDSPSRRPAKRIHTDTGQGWVMVEKVVDTSISPRVAMRNTRKTSSPYSSGTPRPSSRPIPRRSAVTISRRSGVNTGMGTPITVKVHQRQGSSATIDFSDTRDPPDDSPISAEAQKYANRVRKEEKQTDASIRRLNDRLSAMIREGKEALGTKIEVIDGAECEDEGYIEGVFG